MSNSSGILRVRAFTANGALPVEGARVHIRGVSDGARLISFTAITDINGVTAPFILPAPDVDYSLYPAPAELPYSLYDLEISAEGYFTKTVKGMTVFSGITSMQLINMIPGVEKSAEEYPKGNINFVIPENNNL